MFYLYLHILKADFVSLRYSRVVLCVFKAQISYIFRLVDALTIFATCCKLILFDNGTLKYFNVLSKLS